MKNRKPEFCTILIQRTATSEPEHLGVMKAPVLKGDVLTIPMMQTTIHEMAAIAATGHYPHKVIARRWDGSERVWDNPTVNWEIKAQDGFPVIVATVTPDRIAMPAIRSTFSMAYQNICFGERNIPRRWLRKVQRWYYSAKRAILYAD